MNIKLLMKGITVAATVLFLLASAGCTARRELNTLGIIGVMGVDLKGSQVKLTVQTIKPHPAKGAGGGDQQEQQVIIHATGASIYDAIRNATLKTSRKLFWSHTVAYLFSEDAARHGLEEFMDFATRNIETRRSVLIFVVKGASAEEIIGIRGDRTEKNQTDYIQKLIKQHRENAKSIPVNVKQFMNMYYDKGIQPVTGVLSLKKIKIAGNAKSGGAKRSDLSAEGSALYRNGMLIGFLNGNETRALNFVKNKVKSASIAFQNPGHKGLTAIEILRASSKADVRINNRKAWIRVNVRTFGNITEETEPIDLRQPAVIQYIERLHSDFIKREIEDAIHKTQRQFKTDIFGFGQVLYRKNPRVWKFLQEDWDLIFSKAEVEVIVETTIKRYGLTDIPVNMDWKNFEWRGDPHNND